jgi:PAS domain S-box-containing protein
VDAIITIDDHGSIISVNAATERMFGYLAGELVGQSVNVLMLPPYRDQHDGYLALSPDRHGASACSPAWCAT